MPENVEELVEDLANMLGVYGCGSGDDEHPEECQCRICFGVVWADRITRAVKVTDALDKAG